MVKGRNNLYIIVKREYGVDIVYICMVGSWVVSLVFSFLCFFFRFWILVSFLL